MDAHSIGTEGGIGGKERKKFLRIKSEKGEDVSFRPQLASRDRM